MLRAVDLAGKSGSMPCVRNIYPKSSKCSKVATASQLTDKNFPSTQGYRI